MRRPLLVLAALALLLCVRAPSPAYADDAEQQLVNLVNAERGRHGLAPLSVSTALTSAARSYALMMGQRGFFGHDGPDGSTFISRDLGAGYQNATYLGENLAAGQATPEEALAALLNSPEHRSILLSTSPVEIGVGHAFVAGSPMGNYWVQEFGNRRGATRASASVSSRSGIRPSTESVTVMSRAPAPAPQPAPPPAPSIQAPQAPSQNDAQPSLPSTLQSPGSFDDLGRPLSAVIPDPIQKGMFVQYFQRAVLEWHPHNPAKYRIERRLLGDILFPENEAPVEPDNLPPGSSEYFPYSDDSVTGFGHFVANFTRSGQSIYFKDFFDSHGGVDAFGYPKDEPRLENGLWTQHFQAAVFQYHPEYDRDGVVPETDLPWRYFRVQLKLLGEDYIDARGLTLP